MPANRQFDHLTLCSPSGALLDESRLDCAISALNQYQLPIIEQPNTRVRHERFAGSDRDRIEALQMACSINQSSLILATRGGYGLTRLLDQLELPVLAERLNRYQHVLCGHSDLTVLQLALLQAGAKPETLLHGPMASFDFGSEAGPNPITLAHFNRAVFGGQVAVTWTDAEHLSAGNPDNPSQTAANPSATEVISGPVWGGNLAMLCSLLGTPWQPELASGLLILEDVNEPPYKIERMLLQLKQAGILERQQAIILGDFGQEPCTSHDNGFSLRSVIAYLQTQIETPIVSGFPFGHTTPKACWFQGATGQIVVQTETDSQNHTKTSYVLTQSVPIN